jgi:hypothetical protein
MCEAQPKVPLFLNPRVTNFNVPPANRSALQAT